MLEYILIGASFAFAAAIQPGPLQAFYLSSVAQNGWKRTLPAAFAPLISDGPIAVLTLLVLTRFPEAAGRLLQAAGGVFLLYLAWRGYRQWQLQTAPERESGAGDSAPRTLAQAVLVNLLNPNPYLGWSLVLGPAFLAAWGQNPAYGAALVTAFYATIVLANGIVILLFGTTRFLGPRTRRMLILVSAVLLALLGVYQLAASLLRTGAA
jgi:threonine/homoserine/homoserine lactone efflux protein